GRSLWLTNIPHRAGSIHISDGRGRSLGTVNTAADVDVDVVLPAGDTIYVRSATQEARFDARSNSVVRFDSLRFKPRDTRRRGTADEALRRGLFANPYG